MKKQSASTIKLYRIKKNLDKRHTIEALKKALIGLGLKYVPEKERKQ